MEKSILIINNNFIHYSQVNKNNNIRLLFNKNIIYEKIRDICLEANI